MTGASPTPQLRELLGGLPDEERLRLRLVALDDLIVSRRPGWFQAFVRRAWEIVDGRPLVWNWHLSLLCAELERVADGRTRELVIEQPPGTAKSMLVSGMFPAALWLHDPGYQILSITNTDDNAGRDSKRHRDIVLSPWYRSLVERLARERGIGLVEVVDRDGQTIRRPWTLAADAREKRNFLNESGGLRQAVTVGGTILGRRCRGLIVDDPYKLQDLDPTRASPAQIATNAAAVVSDYDGAWLTRVDPVDGWRVTDMQGLAEGDLADVLRKRGVRRVTLPMEAIPDATITVTRPGQLPREERLMHARDPRRVAGEILFPQRFPPEAVAAFKGTADGIAVWGPHYQHQRATLGGRLFPRAWFGIPAPEVGVRRYTGPPLAIGKGMDAIGVSMDCTFKDTKTSDRVSIQAWGWRNGSGNRYLLDRVCDRMDIAAAIAAALGMRAKWNGIVPGRAMVRFTLVEATANGPAIIRLLEGRGMIGYNPRGNKGARAQVTSYQIQAGAIWYPMPDHAPWVHELTEVHAIFTGAEGGDDDDIDAESQIVIYLDDQEAKRQRCPRQRSLDMLAAIQGR